MIGSNLGFDGFSQHRFWYWNCWPGDVGPFFEGMVMCLRRVTGVCAVWGWGWLLGRGLDFGIRN
ncbi:uncharacterized protein BO88DRAFT_407809, partial [Aspergillus vadensis CBS 113365]